MVVVLDTCALLWLTLDPSELSLAAHKTISLSSNILVSSISIWEIGIKVTRKKLDIGTSFQNYVERLQSSSDIEMVPVDHTLWVRSVMLDWNHRDPADRVIIGLAELHKAKIISDDKEMKRYYKHVLS